MTLKQTRNVFISSKYRLNKTETPYDFNIYFPRGFLECNENQTFHINIINFHIANSMYNINDNNNQIQLIIKNKITEVIEQTLTYTITKGNYNVYELSDMLNKMMTGYINITYDKPRNIFIFTDVLNNSSSDLFLLVKGGKYLGLENNIEYKIVSSLESVKPINMVSYNKLVMNCLGLDYNIGTIENISSQNGFEISNILFWASRQDIQSMAEIVYDNADGGNSFAYSLFNKSIQSINFKITDEEYNYITDLPDWTMVLQFSIEEEPSREIQGMLSVIQQYLKDMYAMLYLLLGHFKILN